MIRRPMIAIPYLLSLLWTVDARAFKVSVLIDLDPNSAAQTVVVLVQPDGKVYNVHKNDSKGPLEFPTSVAFVDATAYVSNFDTPRRDNLAADGKTSLDGIGASIVKIEQ